MNICEYGCGREAKHFFPTPNKWCCEKHFSQCPTMRPIKEKNGMFGKKGAMTGVPCPNKLNMNKIKNKYKFLLDIEDIKQGETEYDILGHCKNHNCPNSKEQGGWFKLSRNQIYERYRQLNSKDGNYGSYFYCSNECKQNCSIYGKTANTLIIQDEIKAGIIKEKLYTYEEYQTWRLEVLNRENYKCEYCEELATHVHHSRPQKLEPGFVLDPDFGIACCEKCHYKYGHKIGTECSFGFLSNKECN